MSVMSVNEAAIDIPAPLPFTDAAADKVKQLIDEARHRSLLEAFPKARGPSAPDRSLFPVSELLAVSQSLSLRMPSALITRRS